MMTIENMSSTSPACQSSTSGDSAGKDQVKEELEHDGEPDAGEVTPKASTFEASASGRSATPQDEVFFSTEQSPYIDPSARQRERQDLLSIGSLIRGRSSQLGREAESEDRSTAAGETLRGQQRQGESVRSRGAHSAHPSQATASQMDAPSSDYASQNPLAALSHDQQGSFGGAEASSSDFFSMSPAELYGAATGPSSVQMQHSSSLPVLPERHDSGESEEAAAEGYYGRTRSSTIRRHTSSSSITSAPPQFSEAGVDSLAYQQSPSMQSPFLPSGSASDSASGAGSPSIHKGAFGAGGSHSPGFGGQPSWMGTSFESGAASGSHSMLSRSSPDAQQMNRKKRNKCSPEQYRQLELFFAKNRNPTGKVREELSKRIKMPERSVQVWFQNKRAKTKLNEIKEGIPPEQRTTVSRPKSQRPSSMTGEAAKKKRPSSSREHSGGESSVAAAVSGGMSTQEESVIQLPATSLCVGEWRRIKPLICLFSRRNQCFTWYLSSESVGFKLESPRNNVKSVIFAGPRNPTMHEFGEGINAQLGHLIVEVERPPQFYMEVFRSSGRDDEDNSVQKASWRQCSDFTEGKQATNVLTHIVCGPYNMLRDAVVQLQQTGGPIGQLVEFHDGQVNPDEASMWPSSMMHSGLGPHHGQEGGMQYGTHGLAPPQMLQGGVTDVGGVAGPGSYAAAGPQSGNWASSSTSPWVSDFHSGQEPSPHGGFRTPSMGPMPSYPATPHSATSALDMSQLRIEQSHFPSPLDPHTGDPAFGHNLPATASAAQTHFGISQWPQTAGPGATSWSQMGAGPPSSAYAGRFDQVHSSGAASAPPYQAEGFEQQQQQERASLPTDLAPSAPYYSGGGSNPMGGVGSGGVLNPYGQHHAMDERQSADDTLSDRAAGSGNASQSESM